MEDCKYVSGELLPCPFCGEKPIALITTRGSRIKCSCGATMEVNKSGGHYKNLETARRFSFNEIKETWNQRAVEVDKALKWLEDKCAFNDEKQVYTNGARMVTMLRVRQAFEDKAYNGFRISGG